jgi:hypothetical protein
MHAQSGSQTGDFTCMMAMERELGGRGNEGGMIQCEREGGERELEADVR